MSLLAHNESARLEALRSIRGLTRDSDPRFDDLARLAAEICGVPFAVIGFVEESGEWFKSRIGIPATELSREGGFCSATIEESNFLRVDDASGDARFAGNPLVTQPPEVCFWLGIPLVREGQPIGALGVMDRRPRPVSAPQLRALGVIARQIISQLDLGDITARSRRSLDDLALAREMLEESEDRFKDLFEHADDWVMSISAAGRVLHTNNACLHALGYEELAGRSIEDLVEPGTRRDFNETFDRVMRSGVAERVETVFLNADGLQITVEGGLNPKVIAGKAVLSRVIFRDISDRKRYEAELSRARDAALESARLKSQFLTNISHEIRTPMNGIVGMLDLLLDTELDEEQKEFSRTALSSAEALLATINNILQISRLETGKAAVSIADFDLQRTAEKIVEVMEIAADEKSLRIQLEIDPSLPPVLRGDVAKYRQTLTNLVSNGVKFTREGSVKVRLLRDRDTDTHVLVRTEVRDTGSGIPEHLKESLFEPFTQADGSTTREQSGAGIGLATAKRLVELMGGVLGLESRPGEGTTVWFTIPFETQPHRHAAMAPLRRGLKGLHALLLDASVSSSQLIRHYLQDEWEVRVESVSKPVEALSLARRSAKNDDPFDVVLYDINTPELDGWEFAEALGSDPSLEGTPVILITPLGERLDAEEMRAAGITGAVSKPVEKAELFDALTSVALGKSTSRSEPPVAAPDSFGPELPELPVGFAFALPSEGSATVLEDEDLDHLPSAVPAEMAGKLKILLAEDNVLNQKVALLQLRKLGLEADAVMNGMQVIEAVRKADYDVILMDCQMPQMDGYEATKEIRRREGDRRRIRIIAMTAHALEGDRERCLAAGMDDYLSKPLKQDELIEALGRQQFRA
jgi:two-component system, sensor histidine kinase and response regulator